MKNVSIITSNSYIRMTSIKCRCIVTSPLQMEMSGVHLIEALFFFLSLVCGNNKGALKLEVRLLQPTLSSIKMVDGTFLAGI